MTHVWAGPDHLAAVAPLAVRRPRGAWICGLRWGVGHSAGVALVGLLALLLRDLLPIDLISSWSERLVGVMLLVIGLWGLRKAFQNKVHTHEHEHDGDRHVHVHVHSHKVPHEQAQAHQHTHAAFGIGILHGLAGSSHFLGVAPVLAFSTNAQAFSYLAAFAAGTILSMVLFTWLMGAVASKCGPVGSAGAYRRLMSCCSAAACLVGVFWIAH